ncbi:MAG: ornithine cyclodeaminase [Burkholderiaceae bacterium]
MNAHDLTPFRTAGTLYLSAPEAVELVRRKGLADCLAGMASQIEEDFKRWPDFNKSARVANHSKGGVIELMPVSDAHRYSFKYVNGHPGNTAIGLSTVMAFGVLADVDTGAPLFLSELTLTTALRTAAMSALAAKTLARPTSRIMALIGNGAQSEFQALAFQRLVGITTLRVFDIDPEATYKLVTNLQGSGLKVVICRSAAEAVRSADIVTTVTADKCNALILTPAMVQPGMHINAVGGDCPGKTELHGAILDEAKVFVEYEPQSRIEGEIQHKPKDFPVTELWQVLLGSKKGRDNPAQVTVFDSVGFALEDFSALRFMFETAQAMGLGQRTALVPSLSNPKDLFGTLSTKASPRSGNRLPTATTG